MSEIQPALTPEEWAGVLADPYWWEYQPPQHGGHSTPVIGRERRHAIAATVLHGQPFGFTQEDVEFILSQRYDFAEDIEQARSLAARIAALLPPVL